MKALSLTQPWASLVDHGAKKVETRGWNTSHRGLIAIHAAKGFPKWAKEFASEDENMPPHELPLGSLLCIVKITDTMRTEEAVRRGLITPMESLRGDYSDGRFAWFLEHVISFKPIPCKGALGLWNVPPEVLALFPRSAEHPT